MTHEGDDSQSHVSTANQMPLLTSRTGRQKFRGMQWSKFRTFLSPGGHLAIHAILSLKFSETSRRELPDWPTEFPPGGSCILELFFGMYSQHLNSDSLLSGKMEQQNMEVRKEQRLLSRIKALMSCSGNKNTKSSKKIGYQVPQLPNCGSFSHVF